MKKKTFFILLSTYLFSSCCEGEYTVSKVGWYDKGELVSRDVYAKISIDDDCITILHLESGEEKKEKAYILEKKISFGETRYKAIDSEKRIGILKVKWFSNKIVGEDDKGNEFYYITR